MSFFESYENIDLIITIIINPVFSRIPQKKTLIWKHELMAIVSIVIGAMESNNW